MIKKVRDLILRHTLTGDQYARRLGVKVGSDCRIQTQHFGSEPFLIKIGNDVTVSHGVTFVNHDGSGWLVRDGKGRRFVYRPITIGSHCFIGANSTIMPGVRIGDNVIVGAGSIVTRSIPDGYVVAGNPARKIMTYDEFHSKALGWVTEHDMSGQRYKQRVLSVLDCEDKPFLK